MLSDITERKMAEDTILKQLSEKENLLREVNHRVKNNIANIEGLLSLQAGSTANPDIKAALREALSRVKSMRILYDNLLLGKDYKSVSIKRYLDGLLDSFIMTFEFGKNIRITKQLADFAISSKKAISIGMILNELLTNVHKYAFKDRDDGTVLISLEMAENKATLTVHDNGVGLAEKKESISAHGFGLTIVEMLVAELDGTCSLLNESGTKFVMHFEL